MKLEVLPYELTVCKVESTHEIGIFAVSTYNTDYILVKKDNLERTQQVLQSEGYEISDGRIWRRD